MTPVSEILASEIRRDGPISFARFMETALYHPEHGYYRHPRDPFGKEGDFFTAEQIQPVFGVLIAQYIRRLFHAMGEPEDFTVVELGAGRGEMAEAFSEWRYVPVEAGHSGALTPAPGVIFSNEFFDALPVDVATFCDGVFREQRVAFDGGRFVWHTDERVSPAMEDYLRRYFPPPEEGRWYEANLEALAWIERAAALLTHGYMLTIDYGFTRAESVRFPAGTLMGYRRHVAREDVLEDPGIRDITAHVNFTALQEHASVCGLRTERFETLARTLLDAGEADQFAAALGDAANEPEHMRRRMQLKTLLFGMGENFQVWLAHRADSPQQTPPQK